MLRAPRPLTRIDGSSDDPAQWIPCSVIKPVVELIKTFLSQKLGSTIVEVPTHGEVNECATEVN